MPLIVYLMINYKKITTLTILLSLILTATSSIAQADVKSTAEEAKLKTVVIKVEDPNWDDKEPINFFKTLANQYVYTINSKYNAELGCTAPISKAWASFGEPIIYDYRYTQLYLCNAGADSNFLSNETESANFNKEMLLNRDKISLSNKVKYSRKTYLNIAKEQPFYSTQIKVNEFTVAVASCNEQQNCRFTDFPDFSRISSTRNKITLQPAPLVELSNSQIIFSKFSDGVNQLPNFISEIDSIKFYSAYNTVLYEVKPKESPLYMSNFYSTKVPLRTYKVEICTTSKYCFTTRLEDSIATYLDEKKPARTFALNITNTDLANYQKVGLAVQNANFETANFMKTLTLRYILKETGNDSKSINMRVATSDQELQSNKINKNYLYPWICDDVDCLPATTSPSTNCPNNPTICLTANFTPIKKKTVITGQLIQPDGSPAPYGSLVIYPNKNYISNLGFRGLAGKYKGNSKKEQIKDELKDFLLSDAYKKWPSYKKPLIVNADKNGMFTFTLDLDHYYSKVDRCNANYCLTDWSYLFDQAKFNIPSEGKSILITVPSTQYTDKNKVDTPPLLLKSGMIVEGKVLAEVNYKQNSETYGISTTKYLSPGSYLQTFTSTSSTAAKTPTDEQGNFSLTLPANFTRLEICSASNLCHIETKLNKIYYINIDKNDTQTAKIFTFPAPNDNVGLLTGKLYDAQKKINVPNKYLYLLNNKNEVKDTLKTNSKGEFSKSLNYIKVNKITRIQSCHPKEMESTNRCSIGNYIEIIIDDIDLYKNENINYPYQIVKAEMAYSNLEATIRKIGTIAKIIAWY